MTLNPEKNTTEKENYKTISLIDIYYTKTSANEIFHNDHVRDNSTNVNIRNLYLLLTLLPQQCI